ncbi:hypothetical protein GYMLUDRAFT_239382 [Collybiopsis luxurians FD-317 M1]|nr:hypothetical protein GYMLUDRAFT_239382 [Collybiopsis luxurians FD-317 M1]
MFAQVTHDSHAIRQASASKQRHDGVLFQVSSPFSATSDVPPSDAVTSVRGERLMDHCKGGHNINTLCYGPTTNGPDGLEKWSFRTLCLIVDSFRSFLDNVFFGVGKALASHNLYYRTLSPVLKNLTSALKVLCTTIGMQDMEARVNSFEPSWNDPETLTLLLKWRGAAFARIGADVSGATEAFIARRVGEMMGMLRGNLGLRKNDVMVLSGLYLLFLQKTIEIALVDFLAFSLFAKLSDGG